LDGESHYNHSGVGIWNRVMVGALDYFGNELIIDLGEYEKEFTNAYFIQYNMDRNFIVDIN
jgi:hypothetical protein